MKLAAYEVRNDEKEIMKACAQKHGIELMLYEEGLNEETIKKAQGAFGVSTLGKSKLNQSILHQLKEMGIKMVATRTILIWKQQKKNRSLFIGHPMIRMAWQNLPLC